MTEAAEQLKQQLVALPPEDRADLVRFLLDSLEQHRDEQWIRSWSAELDRRWQQLASGAEPGVPAEEVFTRLREKYPE